MTILPIGLIFELYYDGGSTIDKTRALGFSNRQGVMRAL